MSRLRNCRRRKYGRLSYELSMASPSSSRRAETLPQLGAHFITFLRRKCANRASPLFTYDEEVLASWSSAARHACIFHSENRACRKCRCRGDSRQHLFLLRVIRQPAAGRIAIVNNWRPARLVIAPFFWIQYGSFWRASIRFWHYLRRPAGIFEAPSAQGARRGGSSAHACTKRFAADEALGAAPNSFFSSYR